MPREKLPAEKSQGNMPRTSIFPRQKGIDVLHGEGSRNDQVAVAPPNIVTEEVEARPAQVAFAPAKNEMSLMMWTWKRKW